MNVDSSSGGIIGQLRTQQEYSVAVAVKVQDAIKLEGAAATRLIEDIPIAAAPAETTGTRLNAYA